MKKDYKSNLQQAIEWLKLSFQKTNHQGSSAGFHLIRGWKAAYPETTGYIIKTLDATHNILPNAGALDYAIVAADWLIQVQNKDGSFNGGFIDTSNKRPVVFNTGQIIFGLLAVYKRTQDSKYLSSLEKIKNWLIENLDQNYLWSSFTYQENYSPAYHSRVIWPLLALAVETNDQKLKDKLKSVFNAYFAFRNPNGTFNHWGFYPEQPGILHPIIYTLRGFFESAKLLNVEDDVMDSIFESSNMLIDILRNNRVPCSIDHKWNCDYRYRNLVGEAQFSTLLYRMYQTTKNERYKLIADTLLQNLIPEQNRSVKYLRGGMFGSQPIWGGYQKWFLPNWGVKFLADALIEKIKCDAE